VTDTAFDALVAALRRAGDYNRGDQEPPAAILWPDGERQWEGVIPRLRSVLPVLTLGPYNPDAHTGSSYWIRYALSERPTGENGSAPPIVYLPGVSRAELRAVEESPREMQPLAELQYRGTLWNQRNGRDWTIAAFLQSDDGGLGIEVGADAATRDALQRTLITLLDESVDRLRAEAPLRSSFLDSLLHPDEVRNLLQWLSDPAGYRTSLDTSAWSAFRGLARAKYRFDPEGDGPITAARLLGERDGAWEVVWRRFAEAPAGYPGIPAALRRAKPQSALPLFSHTDSWPQENEAAEESLRAELLSLDNALPSDARTAIHRLEEEHGPRRNTVWAALGDTPLAEALEALGALAAATESPIAGPTPTAIADAYAEWGWRADAALIDALRAVETAGGDDVAAVKAAAGALYRPWLESGASTLQSAVLTSSPTRDSYPAGPLPAQKDGTCILFVDGLRMDAARRLAASLETRGFPCDMSWRFAALPTVTPTAKPAISPVADAFESGPGLDCQVRGAGRRVTVDVLRRTLTDAGWQVLRGDETGNPLGRGWTEAGAIDAYGHEHGWKVAIHLAGEIRAVEGRVAQLLDAGWERIQVVTDHGWLLLPGGLPKAQLPESATEIRKGRCARLKPMAQTNERVVPWYWNPTVEIAIASGICCYEAGREYEHGGISPQECVTPVLMVTRPGSQIEPTATITTITWKGLRCVVTLEGASLDLTVDLRIKPADASSSLAEVTKSPRPDGTVSLLVPDDSHEGSAAMVVLLAPDGTILAQAPTVIGGE
jgi:hypothetical protein